MDTVFSFEQQAFFATALRASYEAAGTWPADATAVSQEGERILREAITYGHTIEQESSGRWDITVATGPAFATLASSCLDEVRKTREAILNRLAGISFSALASGDTLAVQAIAAARADLLDITICPTIAAAQDIEALQAAVNAEYARIAATLSGEAQRAFDDAAGMASTQ